MKKYYEPDVEFIILQGEDVITESGNPVEIEDDWESLLNGGGL